MCSEMDCLFRVTVFPESATVCNRVAILRDRVNRIVDRVNPFRLERLIGSFGGTKEKSSLFEKKIGRFLVVQEVSKLLLMIVLSCAKYDNFPPKMVSTWQVLIKTVLKTAK